MEASSICLYKYIKLLQFLDGEAHIVVGDVEHTVKAGETLIMPSEVPHSLDARENFKMLLTVVK